MSDLYTHTSQPDRIDIFRRLKSRYGEDRAQQIIKGKDARANADWFSWRKLGNGAVDGTTV